VARRNALSYDQLIHDNQRQPDRGYGHER
jgi:hypothetical protein